MATSLRFAGAANTGAVANLTSPAVTLPVTILDGDLAFAVAATNLATDIVMDAAGWTALTLQAIGTTGAKAWTKSLTTSDRSVGVTVSSATGARLALGIVIVAGGASFTAGTPVVDGAGDLIATVPAIGPIPSADSFLVTLVGFRYAQTPTPGVVLAGGSLWTEQLDSATTNTTGTHSGVWAGTRQMTGGATTSTVAYTLTSPSNIGEAIWTFMVAPTVAGGFIAGVRYQMNASNVWV